MSLLSFFPFFSCGLRPWPLLKEHFPVFGLFWPSRSRFSQFLFRSAISSLCTVRGFQSQLRLIWSVGAESGLIDAPCKSAHFWTIFDVLFLLLQKLRRFCF